MISKRLFVLALCLCGAACARQEVRREAGTSVPSPPPAPVAPRLERRTPPPSETAKPEPLATLAPAATTNPTPLQAPAIYAVSATPTIARAGDTIVWNVRTSADVTSVRASANGFTIALQRRGPGRFVSTFPIPSAMPPIFRGTYRVDIEARNAQGMKAASHLTMRIE